MEVMHKLEMNLDKVTAMKWLSTLWQRKEQDEGEKVDYVDTCAAQVAQMAHNFWAGIFNLVMFSYLLDI